MTTTLTILCVISAMFAAGADNKPSEKKNSLTEAELRTIATSVPDTKTASMLHSVAMATSNVDMRQEYLKTAAACLIASDKKDVYAKHIKSKLLDAEEFERGLKDECKQCSGDGTKGRRCPVCNGNGTCTSCKGFGRTASYGFDRPKEWKTCRKCNGSGQCGKCEGKGSKEKCMACAGTGKAIGKATAARVYRDLCNSIADGMAAEASAKPDIEEMSVQHKYVADSINTSASPPKAIADSSGRNVGDQNAPKSSSSRAGAAKGRVDNLDKYAFFEDGCLFRLEGCNVIYAENSSGGVNYLITTEVNLRPQIQFSDGGGAYYDSEIILFSFPTAESRKLWSSAMRSAFEKLLEWINTAKNNKVGHVEKELPESTFKNNCSYASVDWLDRGARQKENYLKAWRKYMGAAEFSKSARRVEFKCVVDSGDNLKFSAKLLAGCSGEFPFELYSCYGKTLDEIHSSVNELLRQIDPDSLAKVWVSQMERNSMFKDVAVGDNSSCDRLSVSKKDEEDARKNADSYRIVHSDLCNSTFVDHCRESSHPGGRDVFIVKDTDGDLNYVLRLGEGGVARRRTYFGRWHTDSDFAFDYHLIVFPTEKLRELWYETVKNSCGRMLEWVHFASRNHVPIVAKPIYNADKDASNKLMAYHNLITKGQGQDDLLKKSLRMHVNSSECERNGFPVSLICTIRNKDSESKRFAVNIELKCGDRYRGNIFETSGDYDCIQKECVEFLHKVDPDGLMEAWKEKCGRDDLFR